VRSIQPLAKEETVTLSLSSIINKFDVRVALDQDRVLQFAGMYEAGVYLPPVRVVAIPTNPNKPQEYAFVDGRHRAEARKYLNLTDIDAVIVSEDSPVELFALALEANWGGAKPPTQADIVHTIVRMLESGGSFTTISSRLEFLPKGARRAYLADAQAIISKRRIGQALDAIAGGARISEAADKFKLKDKFLKDVLEGKKGTWGKSRTQEVELATELKSYISSVLLKANSGIGTKMRHLLERVDAGEVSAQMAHSIIKAWRDHLRKTSLGIDDWDARLQAITNEQKRALDAPKQQ
jgi:hypothetical protein